MNQNTNSVALVLIVILIGGLLGGITLSILTSTRLDTNESNYTKIGVVDSGCAEDQSSFVKEYVSFTNTTYGFFINDDDIYDDLDHGTKVCDLIHNESPNSVLYSARIANFKGDLTYQSILAAVSWLVEEKEVDIVNLSLGSIPYISELIDQVFEKYQNDTIFVAASGNGGTNSFDDMGYIEWPAVYPWVIGVGAYSSENSSLPAYYTVGGLSYYGNSVTEYLDSGSVSGKIGSSFAAPRITGKLSQLLYILRQKGYEPTLNELQGIFSVQSRNWKTNSFNDVAGWGKIDFDLLQNDAYERLNILDQGTIFHAANETDVHSRFSDEKWSRSWKFSTIGFNDVENLNLILSGDAVGLIDDYDVELHPWGGILNIEFNSNNQTGVFSLHIGTEVGNSFEYNFSVHPQSIGKILLDHRTSVNGYGHPYAEFSNFENYLRSIGFIVHHKLLADSDFAYTEYVSIIITRFAEAQTVQNLTITRPLTNDLLNSYDNYVAEGGSLIILADVSDFTNVNKAQQYLANYSAEYTGKDIGSYSSVPSCCPQIVSNYTSEDIALGITELNFLGGEIRSLDENTTEIGWVKVSVGPFGSEFEYLSIGILGTMGIGNYLILGGTNFITNAYFENQSSNGFDTLFGNFMNI